MLEMANFVAESGQERHSAYLVDSLMDVTPMVKGWQAMTDLLLEESPSQGSQEGEVGLTDDLARILIAIMCWAIKQVATGEGPVGRTGQSQRKNKAKDANKVRLLDFCTFVLRFEGRMVVIGVVGAGRKSQDDRALHHGTTAFVEQV